jgi:predicted porin
MRRVPGVPTLVERVPVTCKPHAPLQTVAGLSIYGHHLERFMYRLAFAASLALAAPAFAQSTVTVYGVADAFVQALDGQSRLARLQSGGLHGSRLGFRGDEDLGGGLRAFFTLESGLNLDDGTIGQGGAFYGRQAFVGLRGGFGELSFGRQYSSVYNATNEFSVFSNNVTGPSTALIGGFGGYEPVRGASNTATPPAAGATGNSGPARVNNSLRYVTPDWNGLKASALYGAGEVSGATNESRLFDLELRYRLQGLDVIVSHIDDEATSGGATATEAQTTTLAAKYGLGHWRVAAGWLHFNDKRPADQDGRGWWLGADYKLGANVFKAQYVQNKPRFGRDNQSEAFGIGWVYDLSRRTALYSSLTRFDNDGQAGNGAGRLATTVPVGLTTTGDNSVTEVVLGIRHSF